MFIGHWAPALAAAAVTPRNPRLGTLFVAAQLVDWAFFGLLLVRVEHMRIVPGITAMNPMDLYHLPYTHSLLGSATFAFVFGGLVWLWRRDRQFAMLSALVVLSHWLLDWLVHRPDLTIAGSPPKLGLGLWNDPPVAMALELGLIGAALALYAGRVRPPLAPLAVLALVLLALQAVNWFGPPPVAVTPELSHTAFFAFAVATAAAFWLGKSRRRKRARG